MKASEYRQQFDADLRRTVTKRAASTRRPARVESVDDLVAELTNKRYGARRRTDAISRAAVRAVKRPRLMNALIQLLADPDENTDVRQAALSAIEAASFKTVEFRPYAPAYREALRTAATDQDPNLRAQALDILALNRDAYAQQLLADGLRNPREALVRPVDAIRMLGYDVHAGFFPLLRQVVETSKQPTVRRAALRLLAADSGSRALMRRIATDRNEDRNSRATAALALQSLAPRDFARVARTVVLDDDEDDGVRATVISAIAHGPTAPGRDVTRKVREIDAASGGSRQLNRAARGFTTARSTERTRP
jgi:hypothetical protein